MSDPLFSDYRECNLDVHDYARLLQRAARGHVLWEPSSVGAVGDCGQIRDGQFWKFFNVYEDPPAGIPRLVLQNPDSDIRATAVDNQDVLRSAESVSVSFQGGLPLTAPPASLSLNGAFTWDRSEFAFLVFGGRTRFAERLSPLRTEELQRYLVQHEKQIRLSLGILSGDLIILHGVTRAPAWMGGVARRTSFEMKTSLSLDLGAINIDWGVSLARNSGTPLSGPLSQAVTYAITRGPAGWDGRSDQLFTAVVRSIRVKRRQRIMSQLLNILGAAIAPEGENLPMPVDTARPDPRLAANHRPSLLAGTGDQTGSHMDCDSSFSSSSSTSDWELEGDLLDAIMQGVLDANPSVDAVVGNWGVFADFFENHGDDCLDPNVAAVKFEVDAANVAFIVSLSPRINNGDPEACVAELSPSTIAVADHSTASSQYPRSLEKAESRSSQMFDWMSQDCSMNLDPWSRSPSPQALTETYMQSSLPTDWMRADSNEHDFLPPYRRSLSPPAPAETDVQSGLTMDRMSEKSNDLQLASEEDLPRHMDKNDHGPVHPGGRSLAPQIPLRACKRCKRLKNKCERVAGESRCKRCGAGDFECVTPSERWSAWRTGPRNETADSAELAGPSGWDAYMPANLANNSWATSVSSSSDPDFRMYDSDGVSTPALSSANSPEVDGSQRIGLPSPPTRQVHVRVVHSPPDGSIGWPRSSGAVQFGGDSETTHDNSRPLKWDQSAVEGGETPWGYDGRAA